MFDLHTIEARLGHIEGTVYSDLEREAHTRLGSSLLTAAREIIDVLPDGPEVVQLIETIVTVAETAHSVVHAAAGAADPNAGTTQSSPPAGASTSEASGSETPADTSGTIPPA